MLICDFQVRARVACLPTQPMTAFRGMTATAAGFGDSYHGQNGHQDTLQILEGLKIYDKCPDKLFKAMEVSHQ
jgi:hypothetical protein